MLASKPILDSNNLIKDPVELSGCGILVKPDNAQAIVDGILQLVQMSPTGRANMGERGKQFVAQNHSIKKLAMDYFALFETETA